MMQKVVKVVAAVVGTSRSSNAQTLATDYNLVDIRGEKILNRNRYLKNKKEYFKPCMD